jgi:hypothetical protein
MPYTPDNFKTGLKLADGRWVDAMKFWSWLMTAKTKNLSVVKERRELLDALYETYVDEVREVRMGANDMRIDTASSGWHDDFLVFQSFLSDRAQAEHKPGLRVQDRGDETVKTDNNLSRAWTASLERTRAAVLSGRGLTNYAEFETGLNWA